MEEILSQLARLFIQATPTVLFVFLVFVILDKFFFAPLTAVLKKREEETTGAMERASRQAAEAEEKSRQYEASLQAARQEVYRGRETARRSILENREATLKHAREQSEALVSVAHASLSAEVAQNKKELLTSCQSLGQEIAGTILGGPAGNGPRGVQS